MARRVGHFTKDFFWKCVFVLASPSLGEVLRAEEVATLKTLCDQGDRPKVLASLLKEGRRIVHKAHARRAAARLARDVAHIVARDVAMRV